MRIEINPRSLQNLEHIVEVLYKLHPSVLDYLVDMERSLGKVLGFVDVDNPSIEEREFLVNPSLEKREFLDKPLLDESEFLANFNPEEEDDLSDSKIVKYDSSDYQTSLFYEDLIKTKDLRSLTDDDKMQLVFSKRKDESKHIEFDKLRKYIQLDTDEYIPMKIFVEIEDPVNGRKVKELVRALETTRAPEQFYMNKKEIDEDAYFAEGYGLKRNDEQQKKWDELFWGVDIEGLKEILTKEKLYP